MTQANDMKRWHEILECSDVSYLPDILSPNIPKKTWKLIGPLPSANI